MQEVHINVTPTKRHQRKRKRPQRGFMDKAVIYLPFHVYRARCGNSSPLLA